MRLLVGVGDGGQDRRHGAGGAMRLEVGAGRHVRRQPVDPLGGASGARSRARARPAPCTGRTATSRAEPRQAQHGEDLARELLGLLALVAVLEVLADQRVPLERVRERAESRPAPASARRSTAAARPPAAAISGSIAAAVNGRNAASRSGPYSRTRSTAGAFARGRTAPAAVRQRGSTDLANANDVACQPESHSLIVTPCDEEWIIRPPPMLMPVWPISATFAGPGRAVQDDVAGPHAGPRQPPRPLRRARHLVRGAAADLLQHPLRRGRIEDHRAPDEAGAVEAAVRLADRLSLVPPQT